MHKRYSLAILAVVLMGFDAIAPILIPDEMAKLGMKAVALLVFVLAIVLLCWQGTILSREDAARDEREKKRDELLREIAGNMSGDARFGLTAEATVTPGLKSRVAAVAHELLRFLKEQGGGPNLHTIYAAKYQGFVRGLRDELMDSGQQDDGLDACVDHDVFKAEHVRTIAERLLVLASRIS